MKIISSIVILGILIISTNGCKNENADDNITPAINACKLVLTKNNLGDSSILTYDDESRLIAIQQFDGNGKEVYYKSYTYNTGYIKVTGRTDAYTSVITLNADGTANYEVITQFGAPLYTISYAYDSDGHNIRKVQVTNTGRYDTILYTYTNGNLTKVTAPYYLNENTYTTIKTADPYTIDYLSGLYGKGSKNLPATSVEYFINATNDYSYSYQTNTAGYVVKKKSTPNGLPPVTTYNTYMCK